MAMIELARANRVEIVESIEQMTLLASEEMTPGMAVRIDGNVFALASASDQIAARVYGVIVGGVVVLPGMPITAIRQGTLSGYDLASYRGNGPVYLSDVAGRLADIRGTVNVHIGRIVTGHRPPYFSTRKVLNVEIGREASAA